MVYSLSWQPVRNSKQWGTPLFDTLCFKKAYIHSTNNVWSILHVSLNVILKGEHYNYSIP